MCPSETSGLSQYQQVMNQTGTTLPSIWIDIVTIPNFGLPIQFILPMDKPLATLEEEIIKGSPVVGKVEIEINPILEIQGKRGERKNLPVSAPIKATFEATPTHLE